MQNLFLYGNNAMSGQQGGNVQNQYGSGDGQGGDPNQMSALQQQAAAASQYGMLGMGYMGGAAAHAHAAAAMAEQRMYPQDGMMPGMGGGMPGMNQGGPAGAPQGQIGDGGGQGQENYLDANRLFMQRLGNQPAPGMGGMPPQQWMNYGMPNDQQQQGMPQDGMQMPQGNPMMPGLGPWSSTSAGLLGKMNPQEEKKKTPRKKHKDKPKRPLSAYNIFFKEERKRILESIPSKGEEGEDAKEEESEENVEIDEKTGKKKRKKTPHGKIGFENLAKIIGQRWQELKEDKIAYYKDLAAQDMKRYKEQMEIFLTKQEAEKKRKNGEPVDEVSSGNPTEGGESSSQPAQDGANDDDEPQAKKQKQESDEQSS